jgi:hypothetical protein
MGARKVGGGGEEAAAYKRGGAFMHRSSNVGGLRAWLGPGNWAQRESGRAKKRRESKEGLASGNKGGCEGPPARSQGRPRRERLAAGGRWPDAAVRRLRVRSAAAKVCC